MTRSSQPFGPYRLERELGRGGMAVVYRARDTRRNISVALKMLLPHLRQETGAVARFERELRNAAKLTHPHIVPLYETGAVQGVTYLAMGYADGGTLADHVSRHPGQRAPLPWCAELLTQVASALDYAHLRGVIHRDVKPTNILLARQGQLALLSDFGIAKAACDSRLTSSTALIGSPHYMAPEQITGAAVDHRADVYALGLVLYELLTGHLPFTGETPLVVMYHQVHDPPQSPRAFNPALSTSIEAVVLQALEKAPTSRWETAGMLATAFRQAIGFGAVPSPPVRTEDAPTVVTTPPFNWAPPMLPSRRSFWPPWLPWSIGGLALVLLVLSLGALLGERMPRRAMSDLLPVATEVTAVFWTPTEAPVEPTTTAPTTTPVPAKTPLPDVGPLTPELVEPGEGASFYPNATITLRWGAADLPEEGRFELLLANEAGVRVTLPDEGWTRERAFTLGPNTLGVGTYRWFVRLIYEVEGEWEEQGRSPARTFTVRPYPPTATPVPTETPTPTATPLPTEAPPTEPPSRPEPPSGRP